MFGTKTLQKPHLWPQNTCHMLRKQKLQEPPFRSSWLMGPQFVCCFCLGRFWELPRFSLFWALAHLFPERVRMAAVHLSTTETVTEFCGRRTSDTQSVVKGSGTLARSFGEPRTAGAQTLQLAIVPSVPQAGTRTALLQGKFYRSRLVVLS